MLKTFLDKKQFPVLRIAQSNCADSNFVSEQHVRVHHIQAIILDDQVF